MANQRKILISSAVPRLSPSGMDVYIFITSQHGDFGDMMPLSWCVVPIQCGRRDVIS